jgi:hypothetical protein
MKLRPDAPRHDQSSIAGAREGHDSTLDLDGVRLSTGPPS